jgi:deoxyribodipyrimidine photo-lyase
LLISEQGSDVWLWEIIWREFYVMIMGNFPHVVSSAYKPQYDKIKWPNNKDWFECWCAGQTGFPIIDAGMRELNTTGWMHNRVRMITASFLCKILLIDWRMGEAYFARKLLDFDLSANNGGWQWSSSSGCDAAPYFRIFNPYTQTKKFDPEGEYLRMFAPVLGASPIVNYPEQRARCLMLYKKYL